MVDPVEDNPERRAAARWRQSRSVVVHTVTRAGGEPYTTIYTTTEDVSAAGMRLRLDHRLPEGVLLQLWVEVDGQRGRFFLVGEVRWVREVEEERYDVGIRLRERDGTDLAAWMARFSDPDAPFQSL